MLVHPTEKTIQAVSFTYARTEWKVLDAAMQPDFEYLKTVADGEFQITSRTLDDKHWTVAYLMDNGPVRFYLYDRQPERKAKFLFTSNRELEKLPLVKMHPQVIKTRDGLDLVSYLSLPQWADPDGDGRPSEPLPMVLDRPRRTVGPRRLGLRPRASVAGQPRLCGADRELPRLDRLWQEVHQRRATASGPARCTTT